MKILIFIAIITIVYYSMIKMGKSSERKKFNNGICPKCGSQLQLNLWMIASQGDRGWSCSSSNCDYVAWVSYRSVDKFGRFRDILK